MNRAKPSLLATLAVLAVVVRLILGALAWDPVHSPLTWDDFTRVALAQSWAADPFLAGDVVWLPAQTWLLGALFLATGDAFTASPMAASALLNTGLVAAAAAVSGDAGRRLSGSAPGGLLVFVVVLFSPWGFYTSLSGLAEPVYYLAVAITAWAVVALARGGDLPALWAGAAGVALAAATRYEGWWLAVAWAGLLLAAPPARPRRLGLLPRAAAAGLPFLVPAGWMLHNWVTAGSPFEFALLSSAYFDAAFGGLSSPLGLVLYYPASLVEADPLFLVGAGLVAWRFRRRPEVRALSAVVAAHLGLFVTASLASGAIGAFNERFMFAFLLAAIPLAALLPELIGRLPARLPLWIGVAVVFLAVTAIRWQRPPEEWSHAPDLLALTAAVDGLSDRVEESIVVSVTPEMAEVDARPLSVVPGDRVAVIVAREPTPEADIVVTRLPGEAPGVWEAASGRYLVAGPRAGELALEAMPCPCEGWAHVSETGEELTLRPGPFAWVAFTRVDPEPGEEAVVRTRLLPSVRRVRLEVRSLYGHGFNMGRVMVEVRTGGETVTRWDLAEPSRWREVVFDVPVPGTVVEVAVVAQPGIESGWAWGTVSTVLIRSLQALPG